MYTYWTDEMIILEASKYKTTGEFRKGNPKAYDRACERKLLNKLFDKVQTFWTDDDIIKEASKYNSKNELKKNNNKIYQAALRRNLINDLYDDKLIKWTHELVIEESSKYNSKLEFKKNSRGAYGYALLHNMIDELFDNIYTYWTDELAINEASKYKTKKEFYQNSPQAYQYMCRKNLINDINWMVEDDGEKRCIYLYVDEDNKVAYIGLTINKYERHLSHSTGMFRGKKHKSPVFEYFKKMNKSVPSPIYLEENLSLIESQEKENFYINEFKNKGYEMLNIKDTGIGISSVGWNKWSKKTVLEESKKYSSRTQFCRKRKGAYEYARRHNMLDDLFPKK